MRFTASKPFAHSATISTCWMADRYSRRIDRPVATHGSEPDRATFEACGDAVLDRVLDQRLQQQRRQQALERRRLDLALDTEPVAESHLLDREIALHQRQLLAQRDCLARAELQ